MRNNLNLVVAFLLAITSIAFLAPTAAATSPSFHDQRTWTYVLNQHGYISAANYSLAKFTFNPPAPFYDGMLSNSARNVSISMAWSGEWSCAVTGSCVVDYTLYIDGTPVHGCSITGWGASGATTYIPYTSVTCDINSNNWAGVLPFALGSNHDIYTIMSTSGAAVNFDPGSAASTEGGVASIVFTFNDQVSNFAPGYTNSLVNASGSGSSLGAIQHNLWNLGNYSQNVTNANRQHNLWNSGNYTQNQSRLGRASVQHNLWNSGNYSQNQTRLGLNGIQSNLWPAANASLAAAKGAQTYLASELNYTRHDLWNSNNWTFNETRVELNQIQANLWPAINASATDATNAYLAARGAQNYVSNELNATAATIATEITNTQTTIQSQLSRVQGNLWPVGNASVNAGRGSQNYLSGQLNRSTHNTWNGLNYTGNKTLTATCPTCATYAQVQADQGNLWGIGNASYLAARGGQNYLSRQMNGTLSASCAACATYTQVQLEQGNLLQKGNASLNATRGSQAYLAREGNSSLNQTLAALHRAEGNASQAAGAVQSHLELIDVNATTAHLETMTAVGAQSDTLARIWSQGGDAVVLAIFGILLTFIATIARPRARGNSR